MSGLPSIDWELAGRLARRVPARNPPIELTELRAAVADLRRTANSAIGLIGEASGVPLPTNPTVLVLDRPGWAQANAQLGRELASRLGEEAGPGLVRKVSRRAYALAIVAGLGLVRQRILGQYDPFTAGGRLLLVAPNVLATERLLGVPGRDFRLWVALHEQTHAWQFRTAPWLVDYLLAQVEVVLAAPGLGLALPKTGEAGEAARRLVATMTLLEGHADMMMDHAGRAQIRTLRRIRGRVDATRRERPNPLLASLGLASKEQQYANGGAFCREVLAAAGMTGMNRAFGAPEALPSAYELGHPKAWLERTGG